MHKMKIPQILTLIHENPSDSYVDPESARICVLEYKRKPIEMTEFQWVPRNYRIDSGATRNRTGDTRIFSPLLYQLSYGTLLDCGCKGSETFGICKASGNKKH